MQDRMSRVLIVEDEGLVARSLADMLVLHGYVVPACLGTGAEAVSAAEALRPDLVLMDIRLRGPMDGIEAAEQIRAKSDVPVVFLTAHSDRAHLERAKLTSPHAYLLKPYVDREVLTTIDMVLHRHVLERALRERERWLAVTLRSIGDGVIAVDRDQRIQLLNAEAERLTGWSSADATGRPIDEVLRLRDESTGAPRNLPIGEAMRDGSIHGLAGPTVLVDRGGTAVPVDDSVAAITDDRGHAIGGVVVFRDATERRTLEARIALSERMTSMATLTAGLGHELNNPLTYNLGNLDLVLRKLPALRQLVERLAAAGPPGSELATVADTLTAITSHVVDAHAGADRMRDIIATLRDFRRPPEDQLRPIAVVDVIESALRFSANEIGLRGQVVTDFRVVASTAGHAGQLTQVFTNLLINAAHALPEHSELPQTVRVVVDATADDVIVEISDTGAGIAPEVMVRIFEPFFTTKATGMGTGLGLAIVRAIVHAHGGEVTVTSKVGAGSTFRVRLPRLHEVPAPPPAHPVPASRPAKRRRTVLVVDDDAGVGRLLGLILQEDHDVVVAASGQEALARIAVRVPDVVLSDLMMPGMTGIELHAAIAARHPALARRMLFTTGGAYTVETQAFVTAMGERVLSKPVSGATLRAAVAAAIALPG